MVFTTFIEMIDEVHSPELADQIILDADLDNDGAFTSVGDYPVESLFKLLDVFSQKTQKTKEEALRSIGTRMFFAIVEQHSEVIADKSSAYEVLAKFDDSLNVLIKILYPNYDLPTFKTLEESEGLLRIHYRSENDLYPIAEGWIDGAAEYFNENIDRTTFTTSEPHSYEFLIEWKSA